MQNLIVEGDATTTTNNIVASGGLFRLGMLSFLVITLLDVVVAWALYLLFKPAHKSLSLLAGWFRLVYAAIFGTALLNLANIPGFFAGANYLDLLGTDQIQAQVMMAVGAFQSGWNIGLIVFSLHLFLLGYMFIKAEYGSKILGILLYIAALGYAIDGIGILLLPDYDLTLAMYTFLGEIVLLVWLFWRGTRLTDITS